MNTINLLRKLDKTAQISRKSGEFLIGQGLACFGGPRPEIGYNFNCLHLTNDGRIMLESYENYGIKD